MNKPEPILVDPQHFSASMPDVQGAIDQRKVAIHRVGIKSLRYPLVWAGEATIAEFAMTVALPADKKGTHMSRFTALLEAHRHSLDLSSFGQMHSEMLTKLDAGEGSLKAVFPLFVRKEAPVTGVAALMDYSASIAVDGPAGSAITTLTLVVPVTSLCPCSKLVSDYGAHNQRSHITLSVSGASDQLRMQPIDLIRIAEREASSELYGLLKRADEKFVTERAYDNPKFVEDLVRDVAVALASASTAGQLGVNEWTVEAENFEAIHNHSAYAIVHSGNSAA